MFLLGPTFLVSLVALAVSQDASLAAATAATAPVTTNACVLKCIGPAVATSGCDLFNLECLCTSPKFRASGQACLRAECTAEEQARAIQAHLDQCPSSSSVTSSVYTVVNSDANAASTSTASAKSTQFQSLALSSTSSHHSSRRSYTHTPHPTRTGVPNTAQMGTSENLLISVVVLAVVITCSA